MLLLGTIKYKYLLKEIWLQMKFGEIFWSEVKIGDGKGDGD